MDDLKFIDTLDEEQRANLSRVLDAAEKYGVNPRLAAALAYTESQLRQMKGDEVLRGSAGEIGIMQVKPATGKLMGFEVKQLSDPNANIEAGMKYLKQSIDKFGDPVLGAIGYNAGPDHPFFQGKGDPPAQSVEYVNRIKALGGFIEPAPQEEEAAVAAPAEAAPDAQPDYRTAQAAALGGIGGAALGAGQMAAGASKNILLRGPEQAAQAVSQAAQALSPQEARILQGTTGEAGTTGRARMQGFNIETAQAAARTRETERLLQELQNRRVVASDARSVLAQAPGLTSSPSGVLYPRGTEIPPPAPTRPVAGPLARTAAAAAPILQSPIARYGLAGAGVAGNVQEFSTRRQQEDVPGQALTGMGALGSAMMLSRNPVIFGVGGGMTALSPLALAVLDRARKVRAEPPVAPATEAEMEEARRPVFRYARP